MDFVKHKLAPVHDGRIKMAPHVGRVEGLVASIMACDGDQWPCCRFSHQRAVAYSGRQDSSKTGNQREFNISKYLHSAQLKRF